MIKTFGFTLLILGCAFTSLADEFKKDVKSFTRIIASPHINVILQKGDKENVRVVFNDDVSKGKINVVVKGKTLHLYLDQAKKIDRPVKRFNRTMYEGVSITAYVTYTELEGLEIRGNQELTCNGDIESEKFILKAYGENEITLSSLKTELFKASLYGENRLKINRGKVIEQKYRLFGENKINTQEVKSAYTSTSIFGEGTLQITSTELVRVDAFGEPKIEIDGGAHVNRRLIFGKADIYHH